MWNRHQERIKQYKALFMKQSRESHARINYRFWTLFVSVSAALCACAASPNGTNGSVQAVETTPLPVKSQRANLAKLGPNEFQVQCTNIQAVAAEQAGTNWCWAACAQMILRYNGTNITQEEIVKQIAKEAGQCRDSEQADEFEIWLAMNPDMQEEMDRRIAAWYDPNKPNTTEVRMNINASNAGDLLGATSNPSSDVLVQDISSGNPVVVGFHGGAWGGGHVVLAYGVNYSRLKTEGDVKYRDLTSVLYRFTHRFKINKIMIVDPQPLPGQSQYLEVASEDFSAHHDFLLGKDDARKQLESYFKVFYPTPEELSKMQQREKPHKHH